MSGMTWDEFDRRTNERAAAEQAASVAAARAKFEEYEQNRAKTGNFLSRDVADTRYGNQLDKMPLFGVNWKLKNLKKLFKRRSRGQSGAEGRHHRSRHHRSRHPSSLSRKYNKSSRRVFRKKSRATRRRR